MKFTKNSAIPEEGDHLFFDGRRIDFLPGWHRVTRGRLHKGDRFLSREGTWAPITGPDTLTYAVSDFGCVIRAPDAVSCRVQQALDVVERCLETNGIYKPDVFREQDRITIFTKGIELRVQPCLETP